MKFNCPSCSAKYQIADEKVEGRSLKMKCRKCGAMIPVQGKAATIAPVPSAARSVPPRTTDALRARGPATSGASSRRSTAARGAQKPSSARTSGTGAVAAPIPPGVAGASPTITRKSSASTDRLRLSIPAAPEAPAPSISNVGTGRPLGAPSMPAVAKAQPMPQPTPEPTLEWHVGIGGKIEGPFSRAQLAEKISSGLVSAETYVWREGMAGWEVLPAVAEVADLLAPTPIAPTPIAPTDPRAAATGPTATGAVPRGEQTNSSAAAVSANSSAESLEESMGFGDLGGPLSGEPPPPSAQKQASGARVGAPATDSTQAIGGTQTAGSMATGNLAAATRSGEQAAAGAGSDEDNWEPGLGALHVRRSRNVAVGTIAFAVFAALAFGLAVGFVLFGGEAQTKIIREVIEVPVEVRKVVTGEKGKQPSQVAEVSVEATKGAPSGSGTKKTGSSVGAKSAAEKPGSSKTGLSGLSGLSGLGSTGPASGPSSANNAGGGRPLDSSQIERTVATYRASVKRGCWQPALDARAKNAPSSARVQVAISVSPSGSVMGAKASGDPSGYQGLSSCIARKVRTWKFPPSSGATQVNVPFVFAAQ